MRLLLAAILIFISTSVFAKTVTVPEIDCSNIINVSSKPGSIVTTMTVQNTTGKKLSIYWKSFLGDNVIFAEEFGTVKLKFMNGSYFFIQDDTLDTCIAVFKSVAKDQKIILK